MADGLVPQTPESSFTEEDFHRCLKEIKAWKLRHFQLLHALLAASLAPVGGLVRKDAIHALETGLTLRHERSMTRASLLFPCVCRPQEGHGREGGMR